jgi:hypothetical protein
MDHASRRNHHQHRLRRHTPAYLHALLGVLAIVCAKLDLASFVAVPQISLGRRPALSHAILAPFSLARYQVATCLLYFAAAPTWTRLLYNYPKGPGSTFSHPLASLPVYDRQNRGHLSFHGRQHPPKLHPHLSSRLLQQSQ